MAPGLLFDEFSCVSEEHRGHHSCNQGRAIPHCQGFTRSQICSLEALVRLGDRGKLYDKKREVCLTRRRTRQFRFSPWCNALLSPCRMPIADELREVFAALFLMGGTASVLADGSRKSATMMGSPPYELARLVRSFRAEPVQWRPIMPVITVTDEGASHLPSNSSLPRPHTQVRHSLPSVVRKQGLLQSSRA